MTAETFKPISPLKPLRIEIGSQAYTPLISISEAGERAAFEYKNGLARTREITGQTVYEEPEELIFEIHDRSTARSTKDSFSNPALDKALEQITYPSPDKDDNRDPVESQIYQILGDITFPRSFLPAIDILARQNHETDKKGYYLYFKDRPYKKEIYEKLGLIWPGKSAETDQQYLLEQRRKILAKLFGTREMTELREQAWDLFSQYTKSEVSQSSLAESYFTRKSVELWERMSAHAKDYLRFGADRNLRLSLAENTTEEAMGKLKSLVDTLSNSGNEGTIYIDDDIPDEFYSWNGIDFRFKDGHITGLRFDEGTRYNQHSPLLSFLNAHRDEAEVVNIISSRAQIGSFNIRVVGHVFKIKEHKITTDIDTSNWSTQRVYDFISSYLGFIKTEPKSEGSPVRIQLVETGAMEVAV